MYTHTYLYMYIQVRIYRPVEVLNAISCTLSHALGSHLWLDKKKIIKNVSECGRKFIALCLPRNVCAYRALCMVTSLSTRSQKYTYTASINVEIFNSPHVARQCTRQSPIFGVFIATGKTVTTPYRMKIRGHGLPSESFVQRKC